MDYHTSAHRSAISRSLMALRDFTGISTHCIQVDIEKCVHKNTCIIERATALLIELPTMTFDEFDLHFHKYEIHKNILKEQRAFLKDILAYLNLSHIDTLSRDELTECTYNALKLNELANNQLDTIMNTAQQQWGKQICHHTSEL